MQNLRLLTQQTAYQSLHIADDDMIHIIWKHATIRINVTGLIYLVDFMNGDRHRKIMGLEVTGTPDDGYQIWIQDVGLRLTTLEYQRLRDLLTDGLSALRATNAPASSDYLPDSLKLTVALTSTGTYSQN